MAIDEKHIGGLFYTVLTNAQTSKVALMMASVNAQDIGEVLKKFSNKLSIVQSISRDLSPTYQSICHKFFPQAEQVADKYHIITKALESVKDIRIRRKQEAMKTMRLEQQKHKERYRNYLEQKKRNPDKTLEKALKKYSPERLKNGETRPELLTRTNIYYTNVLTNGTPVRKKEQPYC